MFTSLVGCTSFLKRAFAIFASREKSSPAILVLFGQILVFIFSFAFGWKATPVAMFAFWHNLFTLLASLFCHKVGLVATILQIDHAWLQPKRFNRLNIAIALSLALWEHSLHHGPFVFFRWRVPTRRLWTRFFSCAYEVLKSLLYRGQKSVFLTIVNIIIQDEFIHLLFIHHDIVISIFLIFGSIFDHEKIDSLFAAFLNMPSH